MAGLRINTKSINVVTIFEPFFNRTEINKEFFQEKYKKFRNGFLPIIRINSSMISKIYFIILLINMKRLQAVHGIHNFKI